MVRSWLDIEEVISLKRVLRDLYLDDLNFKM